MEAQNIEYATSENVNDDSNLTSNFWPKVEYQSVAIDSYTERFTPLEAFDSNSQVQKKDYILIYL